MNDVAASPRADGERQRPRRLVPVGALEDLGLALEPAAVRLLDVLAARSEDVEHEAAAGLEQRRAPPAAPEASRRRRACAGASETGQITSGTRSLTGGSRMSPCLRSTSFSTPSLSRVRARHLEHPGDSSTPITRTPASAIGTAIRPVPTASSTTGPPAASASLDVELDILDDRALQAS